MAFVSDIMIIPDDLNLYQRAALVIF